MHAPQDAPRPTAQLLAAAFAGLLSGSGCGDSHSAQGTPTTPSSTSGATAQTNQSTTSSMNPVTTSPGASDTTSSSPSSTTSGDGCKKKPKITETIKGVRTYASLTQECDQLGGLIQIHGACSGVNSCAGFSYGDWGESSTLTRHDCAGVNGCNGLSCVILPKDQGRKPEEILVEDQPEGEASPCRYCHIQSGESGPDLSKFKIYVPPGSTRNATNWLDLPKEAQVKIIAFGKNLNLPDGTMAANMKGYHKRYSRAEIERLVDYIRTRTVEVKTIRTKD